MPIGVYKHNPNQGLQKGHKINNGRKLSEEHKEKLSLLKKGKPVSEATTKGRIEAQKKDDWGKWNKGIVRTEEQKKKISETLKRKGIKPTVRWEACGENHPNWKGDKVGNNAMHSWARRQMGSPMKCANCGTEKAKIYHWSSKTHKHLRDIKDWQRLCASCHSKYDHKNLFIKIKKQCIFCGKEYETVSKKAVYCSRKCNSVILRKKYVKKSLVG